MFQTFMWIVGITIVFMPVGLALFTIFLMLTAPATDEDILDYGHWADQDDIDGLYKRHNRTRG